MKTKLNGTIWLKKWIFISSMIIAECLPTGTGRPALSMWVVWATQHCGISLIHTSHLAIQRDLFSRISYAAKYIEINLEQHARLPICFASICLLKSAIDQNKVEVQFSWDHDWSSEKLAWSFYCNWLGTQNAN